jgi:D-3-phosphoglycerate dehydrogenase
MKILIADKLSSNTVTALKQLGAEVVVNPDLSADDLPGSVSDTEVLIVRSTKVTAATIEAAPFLSLIIRAGAGVNTIDLGCASNRGIHVANCPGKNTDAVAELALGLLIAADRRIVAATNDMRNGKWRKKEYGNSYGLKDRTLGVIGVGSIGEALIARAKGLQMNIVAWSRSLTEERAKKMGIGYCSCPEDVAKASDAVSIHLAFVPGTKHMINKKFFSLMKDGAIFINTSRGEVVDSSALKEAIENKRLRVGLDVFEDEPSGGSADYKNEVSQIATCTPHIGASTDQASEATAEEVVRIVKSYKDTGTPLNTVNIRKKSSAKTSLVVRHFNHVGVLAGVLDELRAGEINIEEMENTIFEGDKAASCILKLDSEPSKKLLDKISKGEFIISAFLS